MFPINYPAVMPSYVLYCLGIIVVQLASEYSCMRYTSNEKFRNLAVASDYVYIGGENNIIHLNSTLDVYEKRTITHYPVNWLLTVHNNKNLTACNYKKDSYELICLNFDVGPKMINRTQKIGLKTKSPSAKYITTTFSDERKIYEVLVIATSSCFTYSGESKCTAISGSLFMDNSTPFAEYPKDEKLYSVRYLDSRHVNFTTVLQQDKYIYFLFNPNDTQSKLGKLCTARISLSFMNSFEDTPIKCTHNTIVFTKAQDAVFWKDYLFVAFTNDSSSAICRYKLTDIETKFKESRQERLKCPHVPVENSYFKREQNNFKWCYNKTLEICESTGKDTVSYNDKATLKKFFVGCCLPMPCSGLCNSTQVKIF